MDCSYCSNQLPERGYYCPHCANQSKCKSCSEVLIRDANACVFCGEAVASKNMSNGLNTIEYIESENGRTFKAIFSDTVSQNIIDSIGLIMANRSSGRTMTISIPTEKQNNLIDNELDGEQRHDTLVDIYELERLQKVICLDGDRPSLLEPRLKAKSKREFGQRLTILYLYYKSMLNNESIARKELTYILENAGVEDGNIRSWITRNPLIGIAGDSVEIKAPGREAAKRFLAEIFDDNVPDVWQLSSLTRVLRKPKEMHPVKLSA